MMHRSKLNLPTNDKENDNPNSSIGEDVEENDEDDHGESENAITAKQQQLITSLLTQKLFQMIDDIQKSTYNRTDDNQKENIALQFIEIITDVLALDKAIQVQVYRLRKVKLFKKQVMDTPCILELIEVHQYWRVFC